LSRSCCSRRNAGRPIRTRIVRCEASGSWAHRPLGGPVAVPGERGAPLTELRNTEREIWRFRLRLAAAAGFVLFAFGLLGARLAFLQVWKHEELSTQAENNRIAVVPVVPNRGLILDRNGIVLASNYSAY